MLARRISLALCAVTALSHAQTVEEPIPLLREAVELARTAPSWRVEGILTRQVNGQTTETRFQIAARPPNQARYEVVAGGEPLLRVCDGTAQWNYFPQRK